MHVNIKRQKQRKTSKNSQIHIILTGRQIDLKGKFMQKFVYLQSELHTSKKLLKIKNKEKLVSKLSQNVKNHDSDDSLRSQIDFRNYP